jgi:hypothetical protein
MTNQAEETQGKTTKPMDNQQETTEKITKDSVRFLFTSCRARAGSLSRSVAPASKVRILSEFAIPTGVVITLPWLNDRLRAKKKQKG